MARLSPQQIKTLTDKIDHRNFLVYAKLLNLTDHSLFSLVLELLSDNRINLSMLAGLPLISDHTVRIFIDEYMMRSDPKVLYSAQAGTFNAAAWLEGIRQGSQDLTVLIDLMRRYNAQESAAFGATRRKIIPEIRLTLDRTSHLGYSSIQEIRETYSQKVTSKIYEEFRATSMGQIFPAPAEIGARKTPRSEVVQRWYTDVFSPFIDVLRGAEAHSLLISVDDAQSKSQESIVEFHEIYNFKLFGDNLPGLYNQTAFDLSSKNRKYTDVEIDAIETSIYEGHLVPTALTESMTLRLFKAHLVGLHDAYTGSSSRFNLMVEDLETIVGYITKFNKVVDIAMSLIRSNFKVVV